MFETSRWTIISKVTRASFAFSVLMLLESCNPEVRDVWLGGIQAAAVGVVSAMTGLLTTAVQALITGMSTDDGGAATVQTVFDWTSRVVC